MKTKRFKVSSPTRSTAAKAVSAWAGRHGSRLGWKESRLFCRHLAERIGEGRYEISEDDEFLFYDGEEQLHHTDIDPFLNGAALELVPMSEEEINE